MDTKSDPQERIDPKETIDTESCVDEASYESFPASDPPAYVGECDASDGRHSYGPEDADRAARKGAE